MWPLASRLKTYVNDAAYLTISQAKNLRSLIFTRKGALSDRLLRAVSDLRQLNELEINSNADDYDPLLLCSLPITLSSLSLLLPDKANISVLPLVISHLPEIKHLTLLSLQSSSITDTFLNTLCQSPHASHLRSLALSGCPKLTDHSLLPFIKLTSLEHLALETCAISCTFFRSAAPYLANLKTLKTTHPGVRHPDVDQLYPSLLEVAANCARLETLTIYSVGNRQGARTEWPVLEQDFVKQFCQSKGSILRRFEIHGIICPLTSVDMLCDTSRGIEDLVLHLWEKNMDRLFHSLKKLRRLRTLHLVSQSPDIREDDVLELVTGLSRTLKQIGVRNRVWTIIREPSNQQQLSPHMSSEDVEVRTSLTRYTGFAWPEALLIIR